MGRCGVHGAGSVAKGQAQGRGGSSWRGYPARPAFWKSLSGVMGGTSRFVSQQVAGLGSGRPWRRCCDCAEGGSCLAAGAGGHAGADTGPPEAAGGHRWGAKGVAGSGLAPPRQMVDPGGWGLRSGLSGAVVGLVGGRAQRRAPEAWPWGWDAGPSSPGAAPLAGLRTRLGKSAPEGGAASSPGCSPESDAASLGTTR